MNAPDAMKKCPFCAEEVKAEAIVCRYCQRDLPKAPKPISKGRNTCLNFVAYAVLGMIAIAGISSLVNGPGFAERRAVPTYTPTSYPESTTIPTAAPAVSLPTVTPLPVTLPAKQVAADPKCLIKGNVNSEGEQIYHMPGSQFYEQTEVKPEEGDMWFCSSEEAQAAGFRAPLN